MGLELEKLGVFFLDSTIAQACSDIFGVNNQYCLKYGLGELFTIRIGTFSVNFNM